MEKLVVLTLATTPKYLEGARKLYESYKLKGMKYPFFIMVWKNTDITGYEDLPLVFVPQIMPHKSHLSFRSSKNPAPDLFSKINVWLFTDYEYALFLDVDNIVIENFTKEIEYIMSLKPDLYSHEEESSIHFGAALLKPNINTFLDALYIIKTPRTKNDELYCTQDEILLYKLVYSNTIKNYIDASFNGYTGRMYNKIFHFGREPIDNEKYWETSLGLKIYNCLINYPKSIECIKPLILRLTKN